MKYSKHLFCFLTTAMLISGTPVLAAPTFDAGGLAMHMKELVMREGSNKLLQAGGEYTKTAVAVMGTLNALKALAVPLDIGTTPVEEWSPVVPKNVAKVLKKDDPQLADVRAEVEKIVYIDKTTPDTLKRTKQQQAVLLLKILAFSYAAAERSLELSIIGYEENDAYRERINKEKNVFTLYKHGAVLQMFSTRKVTEILNLQSRMLEIDSMRGLMNKEKPVEAPKDEKKDDSKTGPSGTDKTTGSGTTPTTPDTPNSSAGGKGATTPPAGTTDKKK